MFLEDNDGRQKHLPKTKCPNLVIHLNQGSQLKAVFSPREYLAMPEHSFDCHGGGALVGGGQLTTLQCIGQLLKQRIIQSKRSIVPLPRNPGINLYGKSVVSPHSVTAYTKCAVLRVKPDNKAEIP